jgi:hypothetical protein
MPSCKAASIKVLLRGASYDGGAGTFNRGAMILIKIPCSLKAKKLDQGLP